MLLLFLCLAWVGSLLPACNAFGQGGGLLRGLTATRAESVDRAGVLNDGVQAVDGDFWQSELTTILRPGGFVEYDLGAPKHIVAGFAHGDNNDSYIVSGSLDGENFTDIWDAQPTNGRGLSPRSTTQLNATARYIRISASGGDRSYALSEVALYDEVPATFPPDFAKRRGLPQPESMRSKMILFAFALVAWVFLTWREASLAWKLGTALVPIAAGVMLYQALVPAWPVEGREVALVRALAGSVAALAVLREVFAPKRFAACRLTVITTLGVAGIAAFIGFFNLLHPQFHDEKHDKPLFVHNFDMRVYFPVAKYFNELRFDGLYMASVAALVDDVEGASLSQLHIQRTELRNLKNHQMETVADVKDEIAAIPRRFTPERWESFKTDMRYFRETMGERDYLGSMRDHGGNATPVWLAVAHLIFANAPANNTTLTLGGLLDPLLLLFAFAAIGRAYGVRTMFVAMAVWGANDFYMFGSNWGGATLRHDWMAYLALGACALKQRWWAVGGALLALSALIRAFPALALVGAVFPAVWFVIDFRRAHGSLPSWRTLWDTQQPLLRTALGAAICVAVCFVLTSALFSVDAWGEWFAKVRLLDRDPHVNHVSLRALVAGSGHLQHSILRARWPLFVTMILGYAGAVIWLSRGKSLDQAALLGSLLIPVVFNPANYYIHFVFVIPLLALEVGRREVGKSAAIGPFDALLWGSLLVMCSAQYWTTLVKDLDLHFQLATVLYFAGTTAALAALFLRDWEAITVTGTPLTLTVPPTTAADGGASVESRAPETDAASAATRNDEDDHDQDDDDQDDDDQDDDDQDDDDQDDDGQDDDDPPRSGGGARENDGAAPKGTPRPTDEDDD